MATSPGIVEPATWTRRDVLLSLRHLPVRYTCEDLRQKVTAILLHLGAGPGAVVDAQRCERALGSAARSPRLRLKFQVLSAATDRAKQSVIARRREVRIAPGEPAAIDDADCQLLRQLRPHLPGKAIAFRLACLAAPPVSVSDRFVMVLSALFAEPSAASLAPSSSRTNSISAAADAVLRP